MTFKGELFPFQERAKNKALKSKVFLLAHRMGLGKTVTTIAVIEELIDAGTVECCLVICPQSIKGQWQRKINEFTDGALVKIISGSPAERKAQYRSVIRGDVEYLIVNYEQIVNDWDVIRLLPFDAIVVDEATAIKNPGTKRSRHIKRLRAPHRLALTGQPIENKPEEAFSIMQWLDKEILGREDVFEQYFIARSKSGQVLHYKHLHDFRARLEPVMDRVTRDEVKDQMPKLVEENEFAEFDPPAKKLYNLIAGEIVQLIRSSPHFSTFNIWDHYSGSEDKAGHGEIMARVTALRMLCDHPALLTYSASMFDDRYSRQGSQYIAQLRDQGYIKKLKTAPKLKETIALIEEILEADPDNKIVVFSFFKPMLDLLADSIKVGYTLFTGDLSSTEREESILRFQDDPRCRAFLSSDAGGIGVDLPMANYLISYDLPWSAGKFEQRKARIDRISSKFPEITVINMIMEGSIEERMLDMLEQKSAIASAWLDNKGLDQRGQFTVTLGTLADFLSERIV